MRKAQPACGSYGRICPVSSYVRVAGICPSERNPRRGNLGPTLVNLLVGVPGFAPRGGFQPPSQVRAT